MLIPQLLEGGQVIPGRLDLVVQVVLELLAKDLGGQHFRQDGGDPQGNPGAAAFGAQAVEGLEQGDVGFGRGLVEPIHAVGPAAVADDVREMGMEHKGEISQGFSHDVLQCKGPWKSAEKDQVMGVSRNLTLTIRSQIIRVKRPRR